MTSKAHASTDYDVVIEGAGLVGASLACALAQASVRVALIDAKALMIDKSPGFDDRAIALSHGSTRILHGIGIWPFLRAEATPIRRIHVSDRGHFGFTRLNAEDHDVDAFGFVTDAHRLQLGIHGRVSGLEALTLFAPAVLDSVAVTSDHVRVSIRDESGDRDICARLLVAADGGQSRVRALMGIAVTQRGYAQRAITANITPSRLHKLTAYERFTETGPLALLPMKDGICGLVWSVGVAHGADLLRASDEEFLTSLQKTFGWRLGKLVACGRRAEFPLALIETREKIRSRLVMIGNAANTVHPIAGQGLNLALRDVSALAQCIVDALQEGDDPGDLVLLETYMDWRRADHRSVTRCTDSLVGVFAHRSAAVIAGRNLGLLALDRLPILKNALVERAMGLSGRQTRLTRGMAL